MRWINVNPKQLAIKNAEDGEKGQKNAEKELFSEWLDSEG
jgi:hypothetical protein